MTADQNNGAKTPEDYERQAAEVRGQAASAKAPEIKQQLLEIARKWDQMANAARLRRGV